MVNTPPQSAAYDAWTMRARGVPIKTEIERRGIHLRREGKELIGPCPRCGGVDRFAVNISKQVFNCRGCGARGDVIDLVKFLDGCDFNTAAATLAGEALPKADGKDRAAEPKMVVAAEYPYHSESGALAFEVVRFEYRDAAGSFVLTPDGKHEKTFRQRRPDPDQPGAWIKNAKGVPVVPYRLPEVIEAIGNGNFVVIVEGEAKADLLWSWKLPATCNVGGADKWKSEHAEYLRGADVVILPDNDALGRKHADAVAASLQGIAASVSVLELPGLPPKGDVIDWANGGGTVEALHDLITRQAVPWAAPPTANLHNEADATRNANAQSDNLINVEPWWCEPETIPPRQWLYDRHYIRGAVGGSIAAGGRGKTTHAIYEAVSMTAGRNLKTGDALPSGPLRVGLLNGEEDQDELDRRVAATCRRYRITKSDLGGRLFVKSVRDRPIRIAMMVRNTPTLNASAVARLDAFVRNKQLDVLMIDPLISFHSVPENDNGPMDVVVKEGFGAIAGSTNSAIELFHHPGKPKPGQAETVVEDARGASAVIWAVRSARVLNFMTPEEATKLGIPEAERRLHIRIANGKANMAPLGKAEWIKLVIENLPNGDQVACGGSWKPPDPFKDMTAADMELARNWSTTGAYRADSRSPDWLGYKLAEHLQLDVTHDGRGPEGEAKDIARIKEILRQWTKNKVLTTEQRTGNDRKSHPFYVPGPFQPEPPIFGSADDEFTIQ